MVQLGYGAARGRRAIFLLPLLLLWEVGVAWADETVPSGSSSTLPPGPAQTEPEPPPGLRCLARWYTLKPVRVGDRWWGELPGGQRLAWEDGRARSYEEQLASPCLADLFSRRYQRGPLQQVTEVDHDPGRIRQPLLFAATYGDPVPAADLVRVPLGGSKVRVHRRLVGPLQRVEQRLAAAIARQPDLKRYFSPLGGGYVRRKIAGTDRPSAHSYGIAVDLNAGLGDYWRWHQGPGPGRWKQPVPAAIVEAFEEEGFIWGGRWYHHDTPHFEYRPELLDPSCYP